MEGARNALDGMIEGVVGGVIGSLLGSSPTEASDRVMALEAGVRHQAHLLGEIRRQALAVTVLSWDSPAGTNFRTYLSERCAELSRSIDLLDSAARHLDAYGRLLRDAELLLRGVSP